MTYRASLASVAVMVAVSVAAGCRQGQPPAAGDFFGDDERPASCRIYDTQAARGARSDATLYPAHFTGSSLNSLGRAKLDLMLKDNTVQFPLVVYLNLPADDPQAPARADAVKSYLIDAGLLASQFKAESGPNLAVQHPAAADLARLSATDTVPAGKEADAAAPQMDLGALPAPPLGRKP